MSSPLLLKPEEVRQKLAGIDTFSLLAYDK